MMFRYTNLIIKCVQNVQKSNVRSLSFRSFIKLCSMRFQRTQTAKAPYNLICQIGDPVLRKKATPVDPTVIQMAEFQKKLQHLHKIMKKYDTVGLAAPQIGLSWQVFAIEITEQCLMTTDPYIRELCKIETCPLTYFINPTMKITNPEVIIGYEMCESISNYYAKVPRATEIEIKALNQFGQPFCWKAKYYLSRIAQHEMDHLQGIMYTDRMFPLTFEYCRMENVDGSNK